MIKYNYSDELWKNVGSKNTNQEAPVYRKVGTLMYKIGFTESLVSLHVFMGKWMLIENSQLYGRCSTDHEGARADRHKSCLELKEFANEYIKLFHGLDGEST